jgi:hypothetical protein
VNALMFDGTVEDLHRQMTRLNEDSSLRRALAEHIYQPSASPGAFYQQLPRGSWIHGERDAPSTKPSALICVLVEEGSESLLARTLDRIGKGPAGVEALILRRGAPSPEQPTMRFLGHAWAPGTPDGEPIDPTQLTTREALLILRAGDLPHDGFIEQGLEILGRQSEIDFVGSWASLPDGGTHTALWDVMPEGTPFFDSVLPTRCVMRTDPGRLLIDLFDERAGTLGEIAYLGGLGCGLVIPEVRLTFVDGAPCRATPEEIAYVTVADRSAWHAKRLARMLAAAATTHGSLFAHDHQGNLAGRHTTGL